MSEITDSDILGIDTGGMSLEHMVEATVRERSKIDQRFAYEAFAAAMARRAGLAHLVNSGKVVRIKDARFLEELHLEHLIALINRR